MNGRGGVVDRLLVARLVGIVRVNNLDLAVAAAGAAIEAGLAAVEITFTVPGAAIAIKRLRDKYPAALIGAGTVRTLSELESATASGAQFLVAPGLNSSLLEAAQERELTMVPGVFTASEVDLGLRLGAELLKVFPSEPLGPSYVASLLQPFPGARLVPTGGISAANAGAYLAAGAVAVAMGSSLFPAHRIVDEGPEVVVPLVSEALAALKAAG